MFQALWIWASPCLTSRCSESGSSLLNSRVTPTTNPLRCRSMVSTHQPQTTHQPVHLHSSFAWVNTAPHVMFIIAQHYCWLRKTFNSAKYCFCFSVWLCYIIECLYIMFFSFTLMWSLVMSVYCVACIDWLRAITLSVSACSHPQVWTGAGASAVHPWP